MSSKRRSGTVGGVLFAFDNAPSAAVHLEILLRGFQTGSLALLADALEFATVVAYAIGVVVLGRRGRRWPWSRTLAFAGGLIVVFVAVGSGLAAYDTTNLTMHVLQHVMLMMGAPPLIALGRPVTLTLQATSRRAQVQVLRIARSRVLEVLTSPPVAWALYYGTMYVFFLTGVYAYSEAHPLFHDLTHLEFLVAGLIYWVPVIGLDPLKRRISYGPRLLMLGLGMPFEAFLGISMMSMRRPIDPINTLASTHSAGEVLWIVSGIFTMMAMMVIVRLWFKQLDRATVQEDRRVASRAAADQARARALLGSDLPEGWTLPWWRVAELEHDVATAKAAGHDRFAGASPARDSPASSEDDSDR